MEANMCWFIGQSKITLINSKQVKSINENIGIKEEND